MWNSHPTVPSKPIDSTPSSSRRHVVALCALLAVLAVVSSGRLFRPLHGDERPILENLARLARGRTVVPRHFNYPPLHSYLMTGAFGAYVLPARWLTETEPAEALVWLLWPSDGSAAPTAELIFSRVVAIAIGLSAVLATFMLGRACAGVWVGFNASVLLSFALTFYERLALVLPDTLVALFAALAMWLSIQALHSSTPEDMTPPKLLLAAAAMSGFAAASKYNGALVLLSVYAAWALPRYRVTAIRALLRGAAVLSLVAAGAFLAASPGWLAAPRQFWEGLRYESRHMLEGQLYVDLGEYPFLWIPTRFLQGEGLVGALFMLAVIWALCYRSRANWVLLLPVLAAFLAMGGWKYTSLHYMLWCFPALSVLSAMGLAEAGGRWVGRHRLGLPAVIVGLCVASRIPGMVVDSHRWWTESSNQLAAERWIESNLPDGTHIEQDWYGMSSLWNSVAKERYQRRLSRSLRFSSRIRVAVERKPTYEGFLRNEIRPPSAEELARRCPEWVVTNSSLRPPSIEPLKGYGSLDLIQLHENQATFYAYVESGGDYRLEREFSAGPGPVIYLYRRIVAECS